MFEQLETCQPGNHLPVTGSSGSELRPLQGENGGHISFFSSVFIYFCSLWAPPLFPVYFLSLFLCAYKQRTETWPFLGSADVEFFIYFFFCCFLFSSSSSFLCLFCHACDSKCSKSAQYTHTCTHTHQLLCESSIFSYKSGHCNSFINFFITNLIIKLIINYYFKLLLG